MTTTTDAPTKTITPAPGVRFSVASRPQTRRSSVQTVSNLNGPVSFAPISLPATGFVRKISLYFQATATAASAGALVAGDAPFNLLTGVTLTDSTGQPITQPVSGYNLYLINKYMTVGGYEGNRPNPFGAANVGPEYVLTGTATTLTAVFRLDLDLEQDSNSGYGSIPNLDSNASLQLKIDVAQVTAAYTGTGLSVATVQVFVDQHYWAPVGPTLNGVPVQTMPDGFGDYVETRYETQTVSASTENTIALTNRGGLIKSIVVVSRAAGVRTAYTANSNVGLILDNNPVDEGILLQSMQDKIRRIYGYIGTDIGTSYAAISAGTLPGLDNGVMVWPFWCLSGGRDSWLPTRVGSLLQLKLTPGASATTVEVITQLAQVKDSAAFYKPSSLV